MKYIALDRVVRTMDLMGFLVRMQGTQRVVEGHPVRIEPGGITEDTDLDLSSWVAERYIMPMPVQAPKAEPKPEPKPEPKAEPLPVRLWRNLVGSRSEQEYMSTVCNRNVRPNTKVVSHGGSRA